MAKSKRRNGHACHPIMRKGGVHEKSNKAKRSQLKHRLRRELSEVGGFFTASFKQLSSAV